MTAEHAPHQSEPILIPFNEEGEAALLHQGNEIQARLISRQGIIDGLIAEQEKDRALSLTIREQYRLVQKRNNPTPPRIRIKR